MIESRPDPVLSRCQEALFRLRHRRSRVPGGYIERCGHLLEGLRLVKVIRALEVTAGGDAEVLGDERSIVSDHGRELVCRPGVELALDAFRVCVFGGVEPTVRMAEISRHVVEGLDGDFPEVGPAGHLGGAEVQPGELRVVVEHLLEMGHEPAAVHRVACETATDVVPDAARRHLFERGLRHRLRLRRPGLPG